MVFLGKKYGRVSCPLSVLFSRTCENLSAITQFTVLPDATVTLLKSIEPLTRAPFETCTQIKIIDFSTSTSMTQPSATSEFLTLPLSSILHGALSRTLV